jgi:uncharacterized protein YxjI
MAGKNKKAWSNKPQVIAGKSRKTLVVSGRVVSEEFSLTTGGYKTAGVYKKLIKKGKTLGLRPKRVGAQKNAGQ